MNYRRTFEIRGIVQGVGFRPTVHRLAMELGLGGLVQNRAGSVYLELQGREDQIAAFLELLPLKLPAISRIDSLIQTSDTAIADNRRSSFQIIESTFSERSRVSFPPDAAMCAECLAEIRNPADRRYGYPFTTCTNCGPRFTVINGTPYDRERTTLSLFPLCSHCLAEYQDPSGRRFHAESIACAACGPQVFFADARGQKLEGNVMTRARCELSQGKILALRGIGGYLLALDAFSSEAIKRLRERKKRPQKPLALMARNLEVIEQYCEVPEAAKRAVLSPEAPIVILNIRKDVSPSLPVELLSPDTATLGMMLPTSPLHLLLFEPLAGDPTPAFDLLVMTSGNRRGEPICIKNEEAFERLKGIADGFIYHQREINLRADDSVSVVQRDRLQLWRRSRGYTPRALRLRVPLAHPVLAMGGELKNAIALGEGRELVLSAHLGDLDTPEALAGLKNVVESFPRFLNCSPQIIAVDLHPDLHSSILGKKLAHERDLPLLEIQHHYAHAASAMAEHDLDECLALTFDGTGYGADGTIWGAELLHARLEGFERMASFRPARLPGADAAVRQPVRQLVARLIDAGLEITSSMRRSFGITDDQLLIWKQQTAKGLNAPFSSAAGRLFDAFGVFLGVAPNITTYDGQAAICLESAAKRGRVAELTLDFQAVEEDSVLRIDWRSAFCRMASEPALRARAEDWALAVHHGVANAALRMLQYGLDQTMSRKIVLSGGVFMNQVLTSLLLDKLEKSGLEVFIHHEVPPNDGGLAAGQAYIAGSR